MQTLPLLQDKLYAQDQWAVLLIFQAMDATGKDGVIKHVMSEINPQGCEVHSSNEELDHDYLWRCSKRVPERGRIGIFNRSYYEEVFVVRVHPQILQKQKVPRLVVAAAVIDVLASLDLAYPKVDAAQLKELAAAKAELLDDK